MNVLNSVRSGREQRPPRIMIYGSEGVGKAQPLDAKILTPTGFVKMGELSVNDEVIGADGGERILRTVGSPACVAKNRYGLPSEIPLSWQAFINEYQKAQEKNNE